MNLLKGLFWYRVRLLKSKLSKIGHLQFSKPVFDPNKTEHAVQSYAAGKTSKIPMLMEEMLMLSNANTEC